MKLRTRDLKVFIAGIVFATLLSGTVVLANPVMREIVFGVRVSHNGAVIDFPADAQPFVMGGRTYLPVRAVADIFGAEVGFDEATNTVLLTSGSTAGQPGEQHASLQAPLETALPVVFFDGSNGVRAGRSLNMGGTSFGNVIEFNHAMVRGQNVTHFAAHNLNGVYSSLAGHIGRGDNSNANSRTDVEFRFYGDGQLLAVYRVPEGSLPIPFEVNVQGVHLLRIEADDLRTTNRWVGIVYGLAGTLR